MAYQDCPRNPRTYRKRGERGHSARPVLGRAMENTKPEICSIRIVFPVESDEKAIECKKKIQEALKDLPDAQIHFSLMPAPPSGMPK